MFGRVMFEVTLSFPADLAPFLRREHRTTGDGRTVRRRLAERTSVKDVVESCGVPHTEVDLILAAGDVGGADGADGADGTGGTEDAWRAVDFSWQVAEPTRLRVVSAPAPDDVCPGVPRLQVRAARRFVADGHLGKLARNLRLLGLDVAYERDATDPRLLEIMQAEDRALLTRDRPLLMHAVVRQGYCPRSDEPETQTREVLWRFGLLGGGGGPLAPFSRCLRCNAPLAAVPKAEVTDPLAGEPLTLRYYDDFRRCPGCGQIYWPGTHADKLGALVARLTVDGGGR